MTIKRYVATQDNIITNGYDYTLTTRGTGSNMGYADSLEVYSIYGQTSSSAGGRSQELARTIVQFPLTKLATDRSGGTLPLSGNVSFYLRMFNVEHAFTLPQDFVLSVHALSQSWAEGSGLDMDEYSDIGKSNWISASTTTAWETIGSHYHPTPEYTGSFSKGYEDLEVNISPLVEQWLSSAKENYGVVVKLTSSMEAYYSSSTGQNTANLINNVNGSENTYYTKRFSSRSSQYFFKRPIIEARWDSRVRDQRENFFYSSSIAPSADNLNTLYYYNYVRGRLVNIPSVGTGKLLVSLYSGSTAPTGSKITFCDGNLNITGGYVSRGIYSASLCVTSAATPLQVMFDVWHSGSHQFYTGSIYPELMPGYASAPTFNKVTSLTYLQKRYVRTETARFRFFIRDKDWSPTVYTVSTAKNPTQIMPSASYSITRIADSYPAVAYGTGSELCTLMSYDTDGNYFDFDMSLLEADYMYKIKIAYYNNSIGSWIEQPEEFKFRVEE